MPALPISGLVIDELAGALWSQFKRQDGLSMEVFCTAIDEFEAETIIVDLMEAGFADNEIKVRLPEKTGSIAISVHADDSEGATFVKSILSDAGGQEIAIGNEGSSLEQRPTGTSANAKTPIDTLLNYRRQYP
ncbi:MAG TPA: hypothetical protein VGO67_20935 [Verrucomicrobiae bacterium]